MMLHLRALKDLPIRVALEEDSTRLDLTVEGVVASGRVRAELDIVQGDHIYYCRGRAVCDVEMACSRCLELYRRTLRGEIEFSIQEVTEGSEPKRDEIPDNEILIPAGASEVDISASVREALLLELPLKPLCREDCRGICPVCGGNRNEHLCDCKVTTTDSRWDGLRDLLRE